MMDDKYRKALCIREFAERFTWHRTADGKWTDGTMPRMAWIEALYVIQKDNECLVFGIRARLNAVAYFTPARSE